MDLNSDLLLIFSDIKFQLTSKLIIELIPNGLCLTINQYFLKKESRELTQQ